MDSFDRIDSSPLRFIMKCFDDIWRILEALSAMNIHYNDLNWGNIMISTEDHKCYLIDFGFVLDLNDHFLLERPHSKHSKRRNISCVYPRCSAPTYHLLYGLEQRLQSGITDADILRENARTASKYEIFSILMHSFVEMCAEMESSHSVIGKQLRSLNLYFFTPKDDGKLPGHRKGGITNFHRAWCLRQQIIEILTAKQHDLQCLSDTDSESREQFMALLSLYDADTPYLSESVCRVIEESQDTDTEEDGDRWDTWDSEQVFQFMLNVGGGALKKYEDSIRTELFSAEIQGRDLVDIDIRDIKELGVTVFADRKMLQRAILNVTQN